MLHRTGPNRFLYASSDAAMQALTPTAVGDICVRLDQSNQHYVLSADDPTVLANWTLENSGTFLDVYATSATKLFPLGTIRTLPDGRQFRYAQAGASNITRGLMQQSVVKESKFIDITQTGHAQVVGATALTTLVTTGSSAALNALEGGRLVVTTGTNLGDSYPIVSSVIETTDTLMDIVLGEPLRNAIAATDKITLLANRWKSTVVVPTTTATAAPAGIPLVDVTAANYYWAQVLGPAPLIADTTSTLIVGAMVGVGATVAGTGLKVASTTYSIPIYGRCLWIGADAEPALVNLELV